MSKSLTDIENILKGNKITDTKDTFTPKALDILKQLTFLVSEYGKTRQSVTIATNRERFKEIKKACQVFYNAVKKEYARLNKIGEYTRDDNGWECEVTYDNERYYIKFNQLLPLRDFFDYGDRENIFAMQNALKKALLKTPLKKYEERVTIQVIHHFSDKMKDYDNLGFKSAVDVIALYLLKDDNPKYMSLYQDYVDDTKNYTEIIVSTHNDFIRSIDKRL